MTIKQSSIATQQRTFLMKQHGTDDKKIHLLHLESPFVTSRTFSPFLSAAGSVNSFWIFMWCRTRDTVLVLFCWRVSFLFESHSRLLAANLAGPEGLWKEPFPRILGQYPWADLIKIRSGFLNLGPVDILIILCGGAVLGQWDVWQHPWPLRTRC